MNRCSFARIRPVRPRLPEALILALRRVGLRPSRWLLTVSVARQRVRLFEVIGIAPVSRRPVAVFQREFVASTSRFGVGQVRDSNRTPLGLHRIATKAGGGWPPGVVLVNRKPVGFTWQGRPDAAIAHRVLWLEGLEPGLNRGGNVDTYERTIYIHGVGDETTLGRPCSRGCVHLAGADLMPWYDRFPCGTLVWIEA